MSARRGYFERGDFDPRNQIPHPTREDTYAVSVTIDSSERDKTIYPDSNSFSVSLPTDIKNVLSVELKGWNPPKTEYNVHAGNNKIDFQIYDDSASTTTKYTATLREGQYTIGGNPNILASGSLPSGLIKEIEYQMNQAISITSTAITVRLVSQYPVLGSDMSGTTTATDTNSCLANRIQIMYSDTEHDPNDVLTLLFATGENANTSARTILGFSAKDHSSTAIGATSGLVAGIILASAACRAEYDYNLHDFPKCIIMDLQIDRQRMSRVKSNSADINDKFAVIYLDTNAPNVLADLGVGFDPVEIQASAAESGSMWGSIQASPGGIRVLSGPQGKYQRHETGSSSVSALTGYNGSGAVKPLKGSDFNQKVIKFNPALGNIHEFTVSFYKNAGILYDFKGQEHKLEFEIVCKY